MKKLSYLFFALISQAAHASPLFDGLYASVGAGGIWMDATIDQNLQIGDPSTFLAAIPSTIDVQGTGGTGYVGLGYSYQFQQPFTLGGKVTADFTNASVTHRGEVILGAFTVTLSGKTEIQLHNEFAVMLKPGYVIKDRTHLYALVGPRWGNFETNLSTVVHFGPNATYVKDSDSAYKIGITAGVGLEHMLTDNLSLGLEYVYTSYGDLETLATSNFADFGTPTLILDNTDIEVSTNTMMAQLSYYF